MTSTRNATAAVAAAVLLSACGSTTQPRPSPTAQPTPTPTPTTTTAPAPTATARATTTLAQCPGTPASAASLPVIHRGGSPDDLAVAPDGALWISDASTSVIRLTGGTVTRTITGLDDPEGMVPLPNGDVVVAEQGAHRVVTVHPDGSRTVLLTLPSPPSGVLSLDGIALDAGGTAILVPDSPHGRLYQVPLAAPQNAATLATGLPRVVGVLPDPTGAGLWLAAEAEAPNGLLHLSGATATPRGGLLQLDDVVAAGGLLYATDLRHGSVHAVDPATGDERTIAGGFTEPQGLAVLTDGTLAVADSPRGVVQRIAACG